MSQTEYEEETTLSPQDHLESLLFQFVNLYERWAEDRQVSAKQGADIAKLIKALAKEIEGLRDLEPIVRDQLVSSIYSSARDAAKEVGKELNKEANYAVKEVTDKLIESVKDARRTLSEYRSELVSNQWLWVAVTILTAMLCSMITAWAVVPRPISPLTEKQMKYYEIGREFTDVFQTLPKEKQDWFLHQAEGKRKN